MSEKTDGVLLQIEEAENGEIHHLSLVGLYNGYMSDEHVFGGSEKEAVDYFLNLVENAPAGFYKIHGRWSWKELRSAGLEQHAAG